VTHERRDDGNNLFSRRKALVLMAAAAAAPGAGVARAAPAMLMRRIPSDGEMLPAVGLGTWQTFDVGAAPAERAPLREVLRRFGALGGRVVDSSPMYGKAEAVVGDLVAELGLHDSLVVATKVWTQGREAGVAQMERSRQRLRVARIDLMQVHNLVDWQTHLGTLHDWKAAGRVRYVGVTHYTASAYGELERIMRGERLDFVQLNYSLLEREAEDRLLPLASDRGIAVLANRPYAEGALFQRVRGRSLPPWAAELDCRSWGQFFLKWILAHPAVTCVIPATRNPEHLTDNMGAGTGGLPDSTARARMAAYVNAP
jgi:aryl-alcohol dehydrogenase-like predicted oxidoreductase